MCQTSRCARARGEVAAERCTGRTALPEDERTIVAATDPGAAVRFDRTQPTGWISTGVPLAMCVAMWGLGDAYAAQVPWLPIMHDIIGAAASVWTVVQLALRGVRMTKPVIVKRFRPRPGLMMMYALLILQPLLATASSMLHGARASIFEVPLPSILPVDQRLARQVDWLHGVNALVLLGVIVLQIVSALRILQAGRRPLDAPAPGP